MKKLINILFILLVTFTYAQKTDFHYQVRLLQTDSVNAATVNKVLAIDDVTKKVVFVSKNAIGGGNQFTDPQAEALLALIYNDYTASFSLSPTSGERGVSVAYTIFYNIISNDDTITGASINQSIGSVLGNVDSGTQTITGQSSTATKNYTLTIDYTRNAIPGSGTHTATYTSYVPQWAGWSSADDFTDDYSAISTEVDFSKYVTGSTSITSTFSPTGEYVWFISNKSNASILDGNNFTQTVGTWGDGTSEFYKKSLVLTLADATTTATVYLYRSRNTKTLTSFTYKIQ